MSYEYVTTFEVGKDILIQHTIQQKVKNIKSIKSVKVEHEQIRERRFLFFTEIVGVKRTITIIADESNYLLDILAGHVEDLTHFINKQFQDTEVKIIYESRLDYKPF